MKYEGPVYRPPSEASSLLIQATVGCPWNRCTFCMVYKKGPKFRIRPVEEIKMEIEISAAFLGDRVRTLFFPSGNSIAIPTRELAEMCRFALETFPRLERITVYGSSRFIVKKGLEEMKELADAGLSRIHVGLESGDDVVLDRVRKGSTAAEQVEAGKMTMEAGIELSEYVVLGLGGKGRTREHIAGTVNVLNQINPDFIRLRTFLPKVKTPILKEIESGEFEVLSPHEVLYEVRALIEGLDVASRVTSDHYTNYVGVGGQLPDERDKMLAVVDEALVRPESSFRSLYVGTE
ncbi:MAG: radical SAM protein [Candidatus Proteinoplasmatales archaeon SG8-5]|nr:MAG: radical SAM protein [Candidatus Proteinoplasmatales archaeon SG8-5]